MKEKADYSGCVWAMAGAALVLFLFVVFAGGVFAGRLSADLQPAIGSVSITGDGNAVTNQYGDGNAATVERSPRSRSNGGEEAAMALVALPFLALGLGLFFWSFIAPAGGDYY